MTAGSAGFDGGIADRIAARVDGIAWPGLLAAGPLAFLAGYALTVLVVVAGPSSVGGEVGDVLLLLVFVFYSAHNVPLDVGGIGRLDWLAASASPTTPDPAVPVAVFYAIPMLVLLATAAVVAARFVDRPADPVAVASVVACLAVSYAIPMAAGTAVFTSTSILGGPARLVLTDAALYGFAYPLAFGTVGAALVGIGAHLRRGDDRPDEQ